MSDLFFIFLLQQNYMYNGGRVGRTDGWTASAVEEEVIIIAAAAAFLLLYFFCCGCDCLR